MMVQLVAMISGG